ncbi:MAG: hypothetical protein OSA45_13395 [Halioglobus sp.]|nr:hypothetical protein [Halioglobus sp.]
MNWKNLTTAVIITILLQSGNSLSAPAKGKGNWSLRLILTSDVGGLEDSYNKLGQKQGASLQLDKFDAYELGQGFAGTYLSVTFYRPEWGQEHDTYHMDFHPVARKSSDEWTFEVRSDDPYRDLSLTWVGVNTKMKRVVLVDLQEGEIVPAVVKGVPQVYRSRMNGSVREFAWRVLTKNEYATFKASGELSSSLAAASTDASVLSAKFDQPATGKPAKIGKRQKSSWLPKDWGQGKGKGYRRQVIPDGLPDDPFTD